MRLKALFLTWSLLLGLLVFSANGHAKTPLFEKGEEIFNVVDTNSKTPQFRILNDSPLKQSLALALDPVLKLSTSQAGPKPYVDVKLEKIFLRPVEKDSTRISVTWLISGNEFNIASRLKKADLLSGKTLLVNIPKEDNSVTLFNVSTQGHFKLRYDSAADLLLINDALAHFEIENPMSATENEEIKFNGKALRQVK